MEKKSLNAHADAVLGGIIGERLNAVPQCWKRKGDIKRPMCKRVWERNLTTRSSSIKASLEVLLREVLVFCAQS